MSSTSSDKRRLAQTRHELREAGEDALRMAAAHETPTETPIYETDRQTNFDRANPVAYAARVLPIGTLTTRTDSHFLIFSQCSNNATNTSHM